MKTPLKTDTSEEFHFLNKILFIQIIKQKLKRSIRLSPIMEIKSEKNNISFINRHIQNCSFLFNQILSENHPA